MHLPTFSPVIFWGLMCLCVTSLALKESTSSTKIQQVLVPSDPVSVPNASAYMVSVGDVTNDVSKAQITFDVPQSTDNSIVIYGVEAFNMRAAHYNGLKEVPKLTVKLKSKNGLLHEFSLDSEDTNDKEYLGQILGFKAFVRGVTQVDLRYDFPTFQGKGEKARRDAFNLYFVAAETGACQTDTRRRGYCDVKVKNLMSLEQIRGQEVDGSKTFNSSICMDSFVAKSLFKAECLDSPIILAEAAAATITVPVIIIAVLVVLIALTVIVVLLFWFRRRKDNYEPTPQEE